MTYMAYMYSFWTHKFPMTSQKLADYQIQSTLFTTTLFVPKQFDIKLNFYCNEFKFKLNWYICANTIDVEKNFAVIKNVALKSFHCT